MLKKNYAFTNMRQRRRLKRKQQGGFLLPLMIMNMMKRKQRGGIVSGKQWGGFLSLFYDVYKRKK